VKNWNGGNGYSYDNPGSGNATNHPVHSVNWYDCVKWCNARSQSEGRTPAYYTDAAFTQVYKTGQVDDIYVEPAANGSRLPTSEQWEYAARGGAAGHRFPWSDSDEIQHSRANYYSWDIFSYDTSPTRGYHPLYTAWGTSPVGSFAANGFGLYDMTGNLNEWCLSWQPNYIGVYRENRGGSWDSDAGTTIGGIGSPGQQEYGANTIGFRTLRSPSLAASHSEVSDRTVVDTRVLGIHPNSTNVPAMETSGHQIAVMANMAWIAVPSTSWLVITAGSSGANDGAVIFKAMANGGAARSGTITVFGGGPSQSFTVVQAAGMSPSGGQIVPDRRPPFTWPLVSGASWYQLWITRNEQPFLAPWVEGAALWLPSVNGLPGGNYQWWVRTWGQSDGYGPWSPMASFSIPVSTPGALTQIAPLGTTANFDLTYRWQKDSNATWYRLWVGRMGAGTWHDRWFDLTGAGEASVNPGSASPGPAKPIPTGPMGTIANSLPAFQWAGGQCAWWVQGWGPDGFGPWAGPMAFSIPQPPGAWYRVYVSQGSTKVLDEWTQGETLQSTTPLPAGDYSFWLGVWDAAAGQTIWSERMDFTVAVDVGIPKISSMRFDGNTNLILKWNATVSRRYSLFYSTNLLNGFSVLVGNLASTSSECAYTAMVNDVNMQFWRVGVEE
jgi:hypothetical protein